MESPFQPFAPRFREWPPGRTFMLDCRHIATRAVGTGKGEGAKGKRLCESDLSHSPFTLLPLSPFPAFFHLISSSFSFACAIIQRSFVKSSRFMNRRLRS